MNISGVSGLVKWLGKIRPNALVFVAALTAVVFHLTTQTGLPDAVLAAIVGGAVAAIGAALMKVVDDPPPPTVPAHIVEHLIAQQTAYMQLLAANGALPAADEEAHGEDQIRTQDE